MQNALKSNAWSRIWLFESFKIETQNEHQIIQTFCRIVFSRKFDDPSLICRNFKSLRPIFLNQAECIEIEWMTKKLVLKTFKIEIQKWRTNNSDFLQNWFLPDIRYPLFNL